MEFNKLKGENEEQFLWRIGQAKDNGEIILSWAEIADIMNKLFREDESEYYNESAYRKPYQQAKRFYDSNVFSSLTNEKYIEDLRNAKQEIRKEKEKLFDERKSLNKILRDNARYEENLFILEKLIKEDASKTLPELKINNYKSNNDLIVSLSDLHLGLDTDNYFGAYNSEIAMKRLSQYLYNIKEIAEINKIENIYVFLLGDIINGNIHITTQLENRENVIKQIKKAGELLSDFIYKLSTFSNKVYVHSVAGNHSRLGLKNQVHRGERLDDLIPWYIKARLSHIKSIEIIDDKYDYTIGHCVIRNKEYLMVHGDNDSFSESGVSKLVMMLGYKPEAIFYGHLHRCSFDNISGINIVRSGSFVGATDDFTIKNRMSGNPSQMVCVVDNDGIKSYHSIILEGDVKNN